MIGFKNHIKYALMSCVSIGLLQAFVEWLIVADRFSGQIFRPEDIFRFEVFRYMKRLFELPGSTSIPVFLNDYLGPGFADKVPLLVKLASLYSLIALLIGALQGSVVWLIFRFRKKDFEQRHLFLLHTSIAVGFSCFYVLSWVGPLDVRNTSALIRVFANCGLFLFALLVAILLYKLRARTLDRFPKQVPKRFAPFSSGVTIIVLITGLQLVWIPVIESRATNQTPVFTESIPVGHLKEDVNVILISVDSLRADHLSCYGYRWKTSPNVDQLAAEGTLFSRTFSVTSWTLPAHLSLFTSLTPEALGVYGMHDRLDPARITLAEILLKNGYTTAGFVSAPFLNSTYGYDKGFQHYDDFTVNYKDIQEAYSGATAPTINAAIQNWLHKNYQRKFFLFLHYWDVHYDYAPPPPYDKMFDPRYKGKFDGHNFYLNPNIKKGMKRRDLRHIISLYDGEIAFTDFYIGNLISSLKELNIFDNSLIIFTADHGDEFLEHGGKGHNRTLYDEVLHIPLIVKFPAGSEFPKGKTVDIPASILDIMPTILSYLGLKVPQQCDGGSLLSSLRGDEAMSNRKLFASLRHHLYSIRSGNLKLIANFEALRNELYDLSNDSREQHNLRRQNADILEGRQRVLLDWLNLQRQKHQALSHSGYREVELSEELLQELKSLGYLQ